MGILEGFNSRNSSAIIGFVGDLINKLNIVDFALGADDDDGTSEETCERAINKFHTVVVAEAGAETRTILNILNAVGYAEALLGKGKIGGNTQHCGVVEFGGLRVELADGGGAHVSIK